MNDLSSENKQFRISLESDRLILRNMLPEDKDFIMNLWTNPDVTKYMGGPRDKNKMTNIVEINIKNPYEYEYDLWVLVEKSSKQQVGHCGFLQKEVDGRKEVEVIYVISKNHWGKGYATEIANKLITYAFEEKMLKRVIALIKPENKESERVAVKCGMKLEKEILRKEDTKMFLYSKSK